MKKYLAILLIAIVSACTTIQDLSPKGAITASYQSIELLVDQATTAVLRGRISPEKGTAVLVKAKKARSTVEEAEKALALCGVEVKNCDSVQKILEKLQPLLLEMERDLQAKEKQ